MSPLGPDKADLSQYTASKDVITASQINLKKTLFNGIKGIKKFRITGNGTSLARIKGSTLTVLKSGAITVAALDKTGKILSEKTISAEVPALKESVSVQIDRKGNFDLNKYIVSTVKPAAWKVSDRKTADVSSDGLLTIKRSGTVKIMVIFPAEKGMKAKKLTLKLKLAVPGFSKASYTVREGRTIATAVRNADTSGITYRTENKNIAIVDDQGRVTGISKGTTRLIMTVKGIEYETTVKVRKK